MSAAPIDRCDVVPVAGKPNCFMLVDRQTGEPFKVFAVIEEQYASGQCAGKK